MDLELATIHQIADELADRGLQFIIAIQLVENNQKDFKLHLCVDGKKDEKEIADALVPLFDVEE